MSIIWQNWQIDFLGQSQIFETILCEISSCNELKNEVLYSSIQKSSYNRILNEKWQFAYKKSPRFRNAYQNKSDKIAYQLIRSFVFKSKYCTNIFALNCIKSDTKVPRNNFKVYWTPERQPKAHWNMGVVFLTPSGREWHLDKLKLLKKCNFNGKMWWVTMRWIILPLHTIS